MIRSLLCRSSLLMATSLFTPLMAEDTLYERLGGAEGIAVVVDHFIEEISFDRRIYPFFKDSDIQRFRDKFSEQLCAVSDGPCTYSGDDMSTVHTGMNIGETDFNRVVELLQNAMTDSGIPYTDQNRLLQRLAPLRGEMLHR
ncbi:MAG: group 1 truncated hemoglobin [Saccharospirillaceae bacterium]|nr:group 1 truncated hemoglobin [Saccharospirillaceae bacterium]MCD8531007.1 group 1 truncated hemoglobin [Saccharospirillaceae bacterium]